MSIDIQKWSVPDCLLIGFCCWTGWINHASTLTIKNNLLRKGYAVRTIFCARTSSREDNAQIYLLPSGWGRMRELRRSRMFLFWKQHLGCHGTQSRQHSGLVLVGRFDTSGAKALQHRFNPHLLQLYGYSRESLKPPQIPAGHADISFHCRKSIVSIKKWLRSVIGKREGETSQEFLKGYSGESEN